MTAILNDIANDRNITVWCVAETTPGILAYPAAADVVAAFDISYPNQVPEYSNSKERAQTRDVLNRCQGQWPAGDWGFSTYCRPAGAGVAPAEAMLLKSLAGTETVTASTSVAYDPALKKPSFSLWFLVDHTMMFCAGATVGTCDLSLAECSLTWTWGGGFMHMGIVGTDELTADAAAAATTLTVTTAEKFNVGGLVSLTDASGAVVDDNAGAGYTISGVDYSAETLTISTGLVNGASAGGFVCPFNPGTVLAGLPLETRTAVVRVGTTDKAITDFTWSVKDEPEYLTRERTPSGYPVAYAETQREVSGELKIVFRRDDAPLFQGGISGEPVPLRLTCGETAGYILTIDMGRCEIEIPTPEEAEPLVELTMPYTALATNGEDSYQVTYT
jgi:hypothetical protein